MLIFFSHVMTNEMRGVCRVDRGHYSFISPSKVTVTRTSFQQMFDHCNARVLPSCRDGVLLFPELTPYTISVKVAEPRKLEASPTHGQCGRDYVLQAVRPCER